MKLQRKIASLLILILLIGCKEHENTPFEMGSKEMESPEIAEQQEINIARKLIKNGHVEFETTKINTTRNLIFESVKKYNGYVSSDQEYKSIGRISNTVIIRVPSKNFDLFLSDATKDVTKFDSKEIQVKDVTEEFLDIQARLKTKIALENRYLEILKKATNVTELLEVEKQIGQLRAEIESIEGRLKYLESQVSLSTLTMTFYQEIPNESNFGNEFKNGFKNGWDNLIWFFVLLINVWPFMLIATMLVFGIKIWRKRK